MGTTIALLGHWGGNIGHDFMAEGLISLLKECFPEVAIENFEQHNPFSIYTPKIQRFIPMLHPGDNGTGLKLFLAKKGPAEFMWRLGSKRLKNYAMCVSAGGPNLTPHTWSSGDMALMMHHMLGAFSFSGVPVLAVSNGSGFPMEDVPKRFDEHNANFWKDVAARTDAVTVRDTCAQRLMSAVIPDVSLIPCTALFTGQSFLKYGEHVGTHVVINFQEKGANTDWGQNVDSRRWAGIMRETVNDISQRHKVVLVCHSINDFDAAKSLELNGCPIVFPKTLQEYAEVVLNAKAGIVSRIHAAIPMAGLGIPTVVIGADTRLLTVEALGLKTHYVKYVESKQLIEETEHLISTSESERDRLFEIRSKAKNKYFELFRRFM